MLKHFFFPQPKGDLYMKLMHKITSKGPLSKCNAGGESMLWTLFPLFGIHEVSVQIEMKDYWGNFANTWKSNFYFALVNYIIVKEERKIAKRLCHWEWHNHDPVLTIGVCKSSLVVSKFCTELLKPFSLIHQTKRNNTLESPRKLCVFPNINDIWGCISSSRWNDAIVSHGKQFLTVAGLLGFYKSHAASHWFWR